MVSTRPAVLALIAACLAAACASDPEPPPGVYDLGYCFCAQCWTEPFCQSDSGGAPVPRADGEACPAGMTASTLSSRLLADGTREHFQCVVPAGKDPNFPGVACGDLAASAPYRNIDVCVDLAVCARLGTDFDSCVDRPVPGEPLCPLPPPYDGRARCGTSGRVPWSAPAGLVEACAAWGTAVPSAAPARFCFLSCIARDCGTRVSPSGACSRCDPAVAPP